MEIPCSHGDDGISTQGEILEILAFTVPLRAGCGCIIMSRRNPWNAAVNNYQFNGTLTSTETLLWQEQCKLWWQLTIVMNPCPKLLRHAPQSELKSCPKKLTKLTIIVHLKNFISHWNLLRSTNIYLGTLSHGPKRFNDNIHHLLTDKSYQAQELGNMVNGSNGR